MWMIQKDVYECYEMAYSERIWTSRQNEYSLLDIVSVIPCRWLGLHILFSDTILDILERRIRGDI